MNGSEIRIRDIVNREVINLLNCENEPIHIPGSIQPEGFLIAVDRNSFRITHCSANCADFLNLTLAELLGNSLSFVIGAHQMEAYKNFAGNSFNADSPFLVKIGKKSFNILTHTNDSCAILEFESYPDEEINLPERYAQTKKFVAMMENTLSLQQLCQSVADETKRLTGYDRVMIYRFDKDYNGEVFAESRETNLEPFLGLHYPHTDIPAQARELYLRNLVRIIGDVNYTPVPIMTIDEGSEKHLDLSLSVLRSVSPIHIEYLKNMGVGATLTVSLTLDKKLWGLVACHHYSKKFIPYYSRLAALLQGHFLTSQIRVREVSEEYAINQGVERHLQKLLDSITPDQEFGERFKNLPGLLDICNATGVIMRIDGVSYSKGLIPESHHIDALINWLAYEKKNGNFYTHHLAGEFEKGTEFSNTAAGILYYALGSPLKNCIIWLRQEIEKTINWAGNPEKSNPEERLTPRKSFALYKQSVRYQSRDWRVSEINAASRFAYTIQNIIHTEFLRREETKYRTLSQKLKKANDELANINWITTHDLKEPLRKILMFTSRIMDFNNSSADKKSQQYLVRIKENTMRMQDLIDDLLSYTLLEQKKSSFVSFSLDRILRDELSEWREQAEDKAIKITADTLPEATVIPFQVRLLFSNLIGNAIKFSNTVIPDPRIEISYRKIKAGDLNLPEARQEISYHEITFADNGIGFDGKFSQRVFEIFYRLHSQDEFVGTGMGLAICKRIAENHDGFIKADGEKDKGAAFIVYLPTELHLPDDVG
ncbi:MAG TPA: ATP-binding protein [Bacteroidia bacterium]|nr:ATP-binding protein [Bacteroidia bacterium]